VAISLAMFLTLVFGMLDLGVALFRKHVASEASRQGARIAIVHGYLAPKSSGMNAWGPNPSYYPALTSRSLYAGSASYSVQAGATSDELAGAIRPYLVGLDPSTVTIQIAWPDGDNAPGSRVTVSVNVVYPHLVSFLFGETSINLAASSTMPVVH
jgi:Flp pilus assembly protein TadG